MRCLILFQLKVLNAQFSDPVVLSILTAINTWAFFYIRVFILFFSQNNMLHQNESKLSINLRKPLAFAPRASFGPMYQRNLSREEITRITNGALEKHYGTLK
jgi:hypothetical protein